MSDPITDRIAEVLRAHKPKWRRIQHPKRKEILVNVLACTGCEWVGEESDHDQHVAAVLVETLGLTPEHSWRVGRLKGLVLDKPSTDDAEIIATRWNTRWEKADG